MNAALTARLGQWRARWAAPLPSGLDPWLAGVALALLSLGVVMVTSASLGFAALRGDSLYFLLRHLLYVGLSLGLALVVLRVPLAWWYAHSATLLLIAVGLLVAVLIPGIGREVNGSRRWIPLGPFTFQVGEFAKLAMVVFTAAYLQRRQLQLREQWRDFAKPLGIVGVLAVLLLLQPDLGSAAVIAATVVVMLFLAGVRLWQFTLLVLAGLGALAVLVLASPYRAQRLVTYLDPWADQFNTGYQLTQSLIAFGRGGWFGVGLGNSVQKAFYLPEAHTDFIFAILAEELGWIGVLLVIALFCALIERCFACARHAIQRQDWFAAFIAFGIGILLAGQTFINVGVTAGLLPTKGLTLPLVSYGGSSLLVSCAMVALVLRLGAEMEQRAAAARQVRRERSGG
ncbi:MAG: putative lipid II flippase FtsW [Pseudomonadota bacterium]